MKNSRISEIYNQIELDEFSKQKIFSQIKEKVYNHSTEQKIKILSYKKITSLIAVCACAIIIFTNPGVQAKMNEYINNLASWITGNSKDDYLEDINYSVQNNNMSLTIINAQRVDNEIRVKYEIAFPMNIEKIIDIEDYKKLHNYSDNEESYDYYNRIFFSKIFTDCKIYVNDICINDVYEDIWNYDYEFWSCEVKDIDVKDNKLTQELELELNDKYANDDFNIRFEFNKFKLDNQTLEPNLKAEYKLKGGTYSGNIEIKSINHEVKIDKYTYKFYGYAYTKTGIKIYANCDDCNDCELNSPIIFLRVTDNYGTKYLFYPVYNIDQQDCIVYDDSWKINSAVFTIYDGPADWYNQYSDCLNDNIKSIDIEVITETEEVDKNNNPVSEKISEFNINFEENNK